MKKFSSPTQHIGEIGEHIAVQFLKSKDFTVLERNFTKKWGEIDVIVEKLGVTRFVEVKSVSCENIEHTESMHVRPEDQMSDQKQERLLRTIETYMDSKGNEVGEWQFDLLCVYIDQVNKKAKVKVLENLILG